LPPLTRPCLEREHRPDALLPIVDFVATANDLQASQLRPYELADHWGQPRRDLLETCLSATRAGLLEYEWHLLCPLCRGAKARHQSLGDVVSQVHCDTCNIDFEVNFDQSVELTFHPNPSIRSILVGEYCIAGPGVTPHVVSQQLISRGEQRTIAPSLESGRYRLRALNTSGGQYLRADDLQSRQAFDVTLDSDGWSSDELAINSDSSITIVNQTDAEQLFFLERLALNDQAATGADVIRLQKFRDLFAEEALRPGERISVGSQAIVFTDLYGSTELYNDVGDASAFGMVMSHFDVIKDAVEAEGGTIVKTMGDRRDGRLQPSSYGVESDETIPGSDGRPRSAECFQAEGWDSLWSVYRGDDEWSARLLWFYSKCCGTSRRALYRSWCGYFRECV
jgi:adenylate cyclase